MSRPPTKSCVIPFSYFSVNLLINKPMKPEEYRIHKITWKYNTRETEGNINKSHLNENIIASTIISIPQQQFSKKQKGSVHENCREWWSQWPSEETVIRISRRSGLLRGSGVRPRAQDEIIHCNILILSWRNPSSRRLWDILSYTNHAVCE